MADSAERYDSRVLHAALLAGGVGIWQWEPENGRLQISPHLETLLGLVPGHFPGTREAFVALLHPVDQRRFVLALDAAARDGGPVLLEFRVVSDDGSLRWFNTRGEAIRDTSTGAIHFAGTIQEIAAAIVAERRMRRQQAALLELVTHDWLREAPLLEALARLCVASAETLEVWRVGIWLYDELRHTMHCIELYDRDHGVHSNSTRLDAQRYPRYFAMLSENRAAAVVDAVRDPRTAELAADYLVPLGITSMLDAPIRRGGGTTGIICHEHIGPQRTWTLDEQNFAASVADVAGGLLEADERRRMEGLLRASEERYRAFIEHSTEAIWRADFDPPVPVDLPRVQMLDRIEAQAVLAECNAVMAQLLGFADPKSVVGLKLAELAGERRSRVAADAWINANFRLRDLEVPTKTKDGMPVWFSVSMIGVIENGAIARVWGMWRDVTDRRLALDALEHQTLHDSLTGLPNRKWLGRELAGELAVAARESRHIALMLIDLDHFKEVNDTLGHFAGDQLLRAIGPRLSARLGECNGALIRLGGDEFAVLARRVLRVRDAEALAIRLLEEIRQPFMVEGARLEVGASIGIAIYPQHGEDASTLLRRADVAMYVAKKQSRGYALYRPEDDRHSPRRLELLSELGTAIRNGELMLHYQPIVRLSSGAVSGVEALVRWPHPRHGMVMPDEFLPLAEMGISWGRYAWVIGEPLAQWVTWAATGFTPRLAVDLSTGDLIDDRTCLRPAPPARASRVRARAARTRDHRRRRPRRPRARAGVLRQLEALGVVAHRRFRHRLLVAVLPAQLPIDTLKIDKSFVLRMDESSADRAIVNSTINLAHNLGLTVVAEGIETEAAAHALEAMGCDHGQGYWIARPMPAAQIRDWCTGGRWRCVDA